MKRFLWTVITALGLIAGSTPTLAHANPVAKASQELLEWFAKKFPRDLAKEGAEQTSKRIGDLVARYGDDILPLLQDIGPRGIHLIEHYGDDGLRVVHRCKGPGVALLESQGDTAINMIRRYGDDGADLLVRHPGVGESLAGTYGRNAVGLLTRLQSENAIRLGKLADDFARLPTVAQKSFLDKLAQGGDDFVVWVWKRKKEVFGSATAATGIITLYKVSDGMADRLPNMIPPAATNFGPVGSLSGAASSA